LVPGRIVRRQPGRTNSNAGSNQGTQRSLSRGGAHPPSTTSKSTTAAAFEGKLMEHLEQDFQDGHQIQDYQMLLGQPDIHSSSLNRAQLDQLN